MPGQQALDLQRTVAFAAHAHELTVVTSKDDSFYDKSIEYSIDDGLLLSIAVNGVIQSIRAQDRDGSPIVVFGKQRWKCCAVIDHLVGFHAYRGPVVSVREAIAKHEASDLGKRIVQLVGDKGVHLTVQPLPPAGGAAKVRKVMAVENAYRRKVGDAEDAFNAQRMDALGVSHEEIAENLGRPLSAIGRLLKVDPDAPPKVRKLRTKVTRPGRKKIASMIAQLPPGDMRRALEWTLGLVSLDDLVAGGGDGKDT